MPSGITTAGRILLKNAVPADMVDSVPVFDKKSTTEFFRDLAARHPDQYVDILQKLNSISRMAMTYQGRESSISLNDFILPESLKVLRESIRKDLYAISQDPGRTPEQKNDDIVKYMKDKLDTVRDTLMQESSKAGSNLGRSVLTGVRGDPVQLTQLLFGDLLVADSEGRAIPQPGLHGYAEGVTPMEYLAGAFGSRKGYVDVQLATAATGYFGKQLSYAAHRMRVMGKDCGASVLGLPRSGDDPDVVGTILTKDVGDFKAGTMITRKMLPKLSGETVLVRSPVTCQLPEGVCQKCSGANSEGRFPDIGSFIGVERARVISEPLTQLGLCLREGTEVRMADWSARKIEDVKPGDEVLGADMLGRTFPVKVLNNYFNGLKDVYRYTYRKGSSEQATIIVECTDSHKFLSFVKGRGRKGLTTCRSLIKVWAGYDVSYVSPILQREYLEKENELQNEPFALLCGLVLGDGCYTESVNGIFFSCADELLISDLEAYLKTLNLKLTKLGNPYYWKLSMIDDSNMERNELGQVREGYRNPIRKWLGAHGMLDKYAHEKELPSNVNKWDNESVAELIGGLIVTDGCIRDVSGGRCGVSYASTSEKMAEQIKNLLQFRFGIYTSQVRVSFDPKQRRRPLYSWNIASLDSLERFVKTIPLYGIKKHTMEEKFARMPETKADLTYYWCRRIKSEYLGRLPVRDLEVDHPDHMFVLANGMISENSSKHVGGTVGKNENIASGFEGINQFFQMPERFPGAAALSSIDGTVKSIDPAPQGGWNVIVNDETFYVPASYEITVKPGDVVEAGDALSSGLPNPAEVIKYKGLGEGRRYFVEKADEILKKNGAGGARRNTEFVTKGFLDKVRITDPDGVGGHFPGELVSYSELQSNWQPRKGAARKTLLSDIRNNYLEEPVLHYTIGTRLTPSVINYLKKHGVQDVLVNTRDPGFEPEAVRLAAALQTDPDWQVRMQGFDLTRGFIDAASKGSSSSTKGASYIPLLMNPSSLFDEEVID